MRSNDDDLRAVLAVSAAEPAAVADGDADTYLALLGQGAVFLPPGAAAKRGAELRAWLSRFVQDASVEWLAFDHGETVVSGDLAVHDYAYVWRVTNRVSGDSVVARGKGVQVMRRQPGGAWKLFRNIWNADPEP